MGQRQSADGEIAGESRGGRTRSPRFGRSALAVLSALVCLALGCLSRAPAVAPAFSGEQGVSSEDGLLTHDPTFLLPGLDHGLLQSPINILSTEAGSDRHNVTFNFTGEINQIENLGHTVQVDFEAGSTIAFDGKTFAFKQMHFHTPAEHLIDGITYPMEMHLVNIREDPLDVSGGDRADRTPEYLVVAFLVKMGKENSFLASFMDRIPVEPQHKTEVHLNALEEGGVFDDGLREAINHYYYYRGSLTTPPFTESVNWYVLKHIFEASPEQILRINALEGDNARHIQRVNQRPIGVH